MPPPAGWPPPAWTGQPPASGFAASALALFVWWRRQLAALAPGWKLLQAAAPDAIIVDFGGCGGDDPAAWRILHRRAGREDFAALFDPQRWGGEGHPAGLPVILRLSGGMTLRREMTLPLAAAGDVASLIRFQMPRLTPFEAAQVFWGFSPPLRAATRLHLTLHLVARERVLPLLDRLAAAGLPPARMEDAAGVELARFAVRSARRRRVAPLACALLALACILLPPVGQQLRLDAMQRRLAALLPAQQRIAGLQDEIAGLAGARLLTGTARDDAGALHKLALLTAALPDGTWLNDLAIDGSSVTFDGQSNDAASLIAALSATRGLRDVAFTAPVTRAQGGGDAFSIRLTSAR